MKTIVAVALLSIAIFFCTSLPAQKTTPALPTTGHAFTVIAHRGDHTKQPENTLAAFQAAIDNGADYVEIDLRTSKDSVLVIMHDASVTRMTGATGRISDLTYVQLQSMKIKAGSDETNAVHYIPRFDEVLSLCRNKINIYLDFKDASVLQTVQAIKGQGMEKQVIVYINSIAQYKSWKEIAPGMPLIVSMPDTVKTAEGLTAFLRDYPAAILDGNFAQYTASMLTAAAALNVPVWPDIQGPREADNWSAALSVGFTGLQTDHPADLIAWLIKQRRR